MSINDIVTAKDSDLAMALNMRALTLLHAGDMAEAAKAAKAAVDLGGPLAPLRTSLERLNSTNGASNGHRGNGAHAPSLTAEGRSTIADYAKEVLAEAEGGLTPAEIIVRLRDKGRFIARTMKNGKEVKKDIGYQSLFNTLTRFRGSMFVKKDGAWMLKAA
jgi:hypothetical protein